ncbi:MAG TPA: GIY-YIG nuclease family protein [Candidatus Glassbacteria bacterium]|nr:GIY-YIG nuclease family protein [Candidatus Glassbacteria bacterium]
MHYIYGIYNTVNGKLYIGYTNDLKRRWYEHKKSSRKISKYTYAIHFAMRKYGIQNFVHKAIDTATDFDEAVEKEVAWIKELKLLGYQLYNETDGGEGIRGCFGHKWTDERKEKMSKMMSGSGNPMYGVQLFGKDNGNYGKKMKPHVKKILLKHHLKVTKEMAQEIKDLFATGNYTQTQLAEEFNLSLTQVHRVVKDAVLTKKNLKTEDVKRLKEMHATGDYTQTKLAKIFNLSNAQVSKIVNGKKWKNV